MIIIVIIDCIKQKTIDYHKKKNLSRDQYKRIIEFRKTFEKIISFNYYDQTRSDLPDGLDFVVVVEEILLNIFSKWICLFVFFAPILLLPVICDQNNTTCLFMTIIMMVVEIDTVIVMIGIFFLRI